MLAALLCLSAWLQPVARPRHPLVQAVAAPPPHAPALADAKGAWAVAGLSAEQAAAVWARRPRGRLPKPAQQLRLCEWLQSDVIHSDAPDDPASSTYLILFRAPKLMVLAGHGRATLQASHAALCELTGLSPAQLSRDIVLRPALLLVGSETLRERAAHIQRRAGLDDAELVKALSAAPRVLSSPTNSVDRRVDWLREELGLSAGQLRRVVANAPLVVMLSIANTLERRRAYLADELRLDEERVRATIACSPSLLHSPVVDLQKKVAALTSSGAARSNEDAHRLVAALPSYFSLPANRARERVRWLRDDLGVSAADAAEMLRSEPAILEQADAQLEIRARFYTDVLGADPAALPSVPQLFTCDVNRVLLLRHAYCLASGLHATPAELLTKGTAAFCRDVAKCTEGELRAFEESGDHLKFFAAAAAV